MGVSSNYLPPIARLISTNNPSTITGEGWSSAFTRVSSSFPAPTPHLHFSFSAFHWDMIAPTARFSDRVENYVKFRPGYPAELVTTLQSVVGLNPDSIVADIGSGTGILSELFLKNGNPVLGVEPNLEMREAAESLLAPYPRFMSIGSTAEATGLAPGSVDLIVAGQAFHWFDQTSTKAEFQRILRPEGGWVALIWNERQTDASPFLAAYEALLKTHGTDYEEVNHTRINAEMLSAFFHPGPHPVQLLQPIS